MIILSVLTLLAFAALAVCSKLLLDLRDERAELEAKYDTARRLAAAFCATRNQRELKAGRDFVKVAWVHTQAAQRQLDAARAHAEAQLAEAREKVEDFKRTLGVPATPVDLDRYRGTGPNRAGVGGKAEPMRHDGLGPLMNTHTLGSTGGVNLGHITNAEAQALSWNDSCAPSNVVNLRD